MRTLYLSLFSFLILTCCSSKKEKATSDLNLYFDSDVNIDSLFISNITQDREFQFVPYSNTLHIALNDSINDLYNINFYTENGLIMNQMWLNGENIIIKGNVSNTVKIDTVIGSDLYYTSLDFKNRYKQLTLSETDSTVINNFLLDEFKKNIENPYSIEIADIFFRRNISRKAELAQIYRLQSNQSAPIKNHLINPFTKIKKILTVNEIDLSDFKFYDEQSNTISIQLEKDKRYVIDFWFTSCAPCIKDHQSIVEMQKFFDDRSVELIGMSTDMKQTKWAEFIKKKKYFWQNFREVDDYEKRLSTDMLITTYPTYLILDGTGQILYRANALSEIEQFLR